MENSHLPIALFNGTIATTNGLYRVSDISQSEARKLIKEHSYISAIGHEATVEIMSEILNVSVAYNRIQFKQALGQKAIVFKLKERPIEGLVLSKEEIVKIGYSLKLMERLE